MSDLPAETTEKLKRASGACYLFNNQNRRARGGGLPSSYKLPELSESRRELNSRYKSADPTCAPADFTELTRRRHESWSLVIRPRQKSATLYAARVFISLYSPRLHESVLSRCTKKFKSRILILNLTIS